MHYAANLAVVDYLPERDRQAARKAIRDEQRAALKVLKDNHQAAKRNASAIAQARRYTIKAFAPAISPHRPNRPYLRRRVTRRHAQQG